LTVVRGRLIALEGIDGCGKSTQARLLAERLGAVSTFEPGATALGKSLRALLLDRQEAPVSTRAEALLMAADRAQHVTDVIVPALESGQWVVTDRYSPSTLAYQGFGRGLDREVLEALVGWATAGLRPDLTVLFDVPVLVAASRRSGAADRMEAEGEAFLQRVADGYLTLAAESAESEERWLVVDATGPVEAIAETIWEAVDALAGADGPPTSGSGAIP